WSIATVATSAFVTMYYLLVMREDQAALRDAPVATPARKLEITVIAPASAADLIVALRTIEGARIRSWVRTDSDDRDLSGTQIESIRAAVATTEAERIAVLVSDDGVEVVPFREA
ncbi:MAG: hypothetical protein WCL53_08150, partial [Chloroflexota bacterium]